MPGRMICYLEDGVVSAVKPGYVRVKFNERNLESFWLAVVVPSAGYNRYKNPFKEGDPVTCLMDEHCEAGIVIGGVYSGANPGKDGNITGIDFGDGGGVNYDTDSGELDIVVKGNQKINIGGDAEITVAKNAKINVGGSAEATVAENASFNVGGNAEATVTGNARLKAAAVNLDSADIKCGGDAAVNGVVHDKSPCPLFGILHPGSVVTKTMP